MTVTAGQARVEYAGNGSTVAFAYPYEFFQNDDLKVYDYDTVAKTGTPLILNTDYTVSGALNPTGGTVTLMTATASGHTLSIVNDPDMVQPTHYVNADDFPAASHETALDRLTKITQRLGDRIDRAVRSPDYIPVADVPDADTLLGAVDQATDAANDSAASAGNSANSATQAHNAELAAESAANAAGTYANDAQSSENAAQTYATSAANSANAAQVAKITWRGPWSSTTNYVANDAVGYAGSSYIAKVANLNVTPALGATWDILAQQGSAGGGTGTGDMIGANNLAQGPGGVANVATARLNLGLGGSAVLNVGTATGTVAAGDDARFATIASKAPLASPVFTGDPQCPTAAPGDNDTSLANTAFVTAAGAALQIGTTQIVNGAVTFAKMAAAALATTAQFLANTASLLLTTDQVWAGAVPVTLTDAATVTPNFSLGINFLWTIGAAGRTLANPTSMKVGQTGILYLIQDGTGGRTITTWGSQWKFSGGIKPVLSTAANAVDMLAYAVKSSTEIECSFQAGMA